MAPSRVKAASNGRKSAVSGSASSPRKAALLKRRRRESNPLTTALQAVAVPSGSSVEILRLASSPGIEPGLRPSHGRVPPPHSEDKLRFIRAAMPRSRSRTSSGSFEDCHAIRHTRGAKVSRPGVEPGPEPSEGSMPIRYTIGTFRNRPPGAIPLQWPRGESNSHARFGGTTF